MEDDAEASEILRSALEAVGHTVVTATEGPAGLDLLLEGRFDVALVDIGLPFMSGVRLARDARQILGDKVPPLVAVTGRARAEDREEAKAAGFAAHLVKPVSLPQLLNTIETLAQPNRTRD